MLSSIAISGSDNRSVDRDACSSSDRDQARPQNGARPATLGWPGTDSWGVRLPDCIRPMLGLLLRDLRLQGWQSLCCWVGMQMMALTAWPSVGQAGSSMQMSASLGYRTLLPR